MSAVATENQSPRGLNVEGIENLEMLGRQVIECMQTLREFGAWLESEGLQAIATRVSTGEECSIIIEDGTGTLTADVKPATESPLF